MDAFKTNKSLRAELEALKTEREQNFDSLESLQSQLDAANQSIIEKDETIATLTAAKCELEESSESILADALEKDELIESLNNKLAETEQSTNAKAIEIVAAAGHQERLDVESSEGTSNADMRKKYQELQKTNPQEATKFWNENKAAIIAG